MKKAFLLLINLVPLVIFSQSWQEIQVPTTKNLKDVYFLDENNGWIIGEKGTILKYYYGDWVSVESEYSGYDFNALFFTDSINGWIIGDDGVICKYLDGTISTLTSPTSQDLNDIYMIDSNSGWIVGDNGTILEFKNNVWTEYLTETFSNDVQGLNNIQFLDSTFGIITGEYNRIIKFVDGAWNEVENPTNMQDYMGLYIADKENIFWFHCDNYGGAGHIPAGRFEKFNASTNITQFVGTFGYMTNVEISLIGSNKGWAVGGRSIFEFNGNGFSRFGNTEKFLNSVWIVNDTIGWIVGDGGHVLEYNHLISTVENIDDLQKIKVYPNPFRDQLYIEIDDSFTSLVIIDLNGRVIKEYNLLESDLLLNLNFLDKGMYFLKASNKNNEYTHKIIKN